MHSVFSGKRLDSCAGQIAMYITSVLLLVASLAVGSAGTQSTAPSSPAPTAAETADLNLRAYAELLRSDVRTQKVAIITQMMAFTEAEDALFWPIYREYDVELSKLGDERVGLIQEFAVNYEQMTDATADKLATKALDLEGRRHALKAKYYDRLKKVLSPKTAARFLQVEHQLLLLIDLQISSSLPVVK
jgi:hypothetical protein